MTDAVIDRFAVRWRLAAPQLRHEAKTLLDVLLEDVLDEALAGIVAADEQVAIRSVHVPPVRVRAGLTAEAAGAWARQVAAAVAGQLAAGGPSVVRYPSRPAALLDLTLRACAGDTSPVWAWTRLGLWPATTAAGGGTSTGVADAVSAALAAQPMAVAPVLAAVAARGALPRVVAVLGPPRLERLATVAWQALGGAPEEVRPAGAPDIRTGAAAPAAPASGATHGGPFTSGLTSPAPGDSGAAAELLSRSPLGAAALDGHDARVRAALTALAIADADPGRVASDGAALLRLALSEPAARRQTVRKRAVREPAVPESAPVDGHEDGRRPAPCTHGAERACPVVSGNAGLLFCLHLIAPLMSRAGSPQECAPLFALDGLGTRAAMHALGTELLRRSAPRPRAPDPADPALLAFCGLPPSAGPPGPAGDADHGAVRREAARLADRTVRALRLRVAGRPPAGLPQTALLAELLHRRGEIIASPGWLELRFDLDDVSVDLRAAGLDLDPGWLPALGCIVRFRYV
ncbi:hypothetical protein [Streptomyces tagetis]|uniref:Uncharacterized protein n=1 Tax=Streptomyces tagetis TaxID=2820809 RepID=A0A941B0E5_9ACTN|nr:hypothetical protein [Streptomyces sp. RG38]MBQ0826646.1 hypothetical protein [Streptomyces sp. RG38]